MIDLKEISIKIKSANTILDDMIVKANEQGARNFEMLYTVKDGLSELSGQLLTTGVITHSFVAKWDVIMGWIPRVFEGHPLLDILEKIDDFVVKNKV
jgi:hypothetical protein